MVPLGPCESVCWHPLHKGHDLQVETAGLGCPCVALLGGLVCFLGTSFRKFPLFFQEPFLKSELIYLRIWVFRLHVHLYTRRGHWIPWDYSKRQLWATVSVLKMELGASGKQPVLLTVEPSHQPASYIYYKKKLFNQWSSTTQIRSFISDHIVGICSIILRLSQQSSTFHESLYI